MTFRPPIPPCLSLAQANSHGSGRSLGADGDGGGDEIEVFVPLLLVVLTPEELVDKVWGETRRCGVEVAEGGSTPWASIHTSFSAHASDEPDPRLFTSHPPTLLISLGFSQPAAHSDSVWPGMLGSPLTRAPEPPYSRGRLGLLSACRSTCPPHSAPSSPSPPPPLPSPLSSRPTSCKDCSHWPPGTTPTVRYR